MGFLFALIGYVTAVAVMVGGAIAAAVWVTKPVPERATSESIQHAAPQTKDDSAKRMRGSEAALTSQKSAKRHAIRRRAARRGSARR